MLNHEGREEIEGHEEASAVRDLRGLKTEGYADRRTTTAVMLSVLPEVNACSTS